MTIDMDFTALAAAIAAIWALYKAICYLMDRYHIGDKRKTDEALKKASRNNMREIIRMNYHQHAVLDGWISEEELEHVEQVYETYHALGGNGTATRWIEELRALPREKDKQGFFKKLDKSQSFSSNENH